MDNTPTTGLDSRFAQELGHQLRALRERRRESVEDVGRRLLMSANQIRALEDGEGEPFYGPRYHLQAARKYAAMSGLDFDALEAEFAPMGAQMADDDADAQGGLPFLAGESRAAAGSIGQRSAARTGLSGTSRKLALGGVAALAVVVIAVVAVRLLPGEKGDPTGKVTSEVTVKPQDASNPAGTPAQASQGGSAPVTPGVPPAPTAQPGASGAVSAPSATAPAAAPVGVAPLPSTSTASSTAMPASPASAASPATATPAPSASAAAPTESTPRKPKTADAPAKATGPGPGELRVTFTGSGWMQVVKRDGTRQTRNYRAKQSVTLQRKDLQAVVISDWRKATMVSEGQKVDLSRHRPAGTNQAKLTGAKLRALGE
jgi:cytoskeletal protein RodZ